MKFRFTFAPALKMRGHIYKIANELNLDQLKKSFEIIIKKVAGIKIRFTFAPALKTRSEIQKRQTS